MNTATELARLESEVANAMSAWQAAEGEKRVIAFRWLETVGSLAAECRKRTMVARILSEEQGR